MELVNSRITFHAEVEIIRTGELKENIKINMNQPQEPSAV